MKHILLLGAGRSASVLISYLLQHAPAQNWTITIGDMNVDHLAPALQNLPFANAIEFNINDELQRETEIIKADLVISLLPAMFHIKVATECLRLHKNMITASYVSPEIKA